MFIEDATTNLLTYSEDFGNAAWTKTAVTVSGDFTYAPDGTKSADKINETSATDLHYVASASQTFTSGITYTLSIYTKASTRDVLQVVPPASAFPVAFANFNLTTGSLGSYSGLTAASMTPVGNGWYRCSITLVATSTTSDPVFFLMQLSDTAPRSTTYAGDGYSGIYIWGAQLEANSASPSSYVVTAGATAYRSYDNVVMTGTNFSSWYNQEEGSVYAEFKIDQKPLNGVGGFDNYVVNVSDVPHGNQHMLLISPSAELRVNSYYNFNSQASLSITTPLIVGDIYRLASSFKTGSFEASANASIPLSDVSGTLSKNMNILQLGAFTTGASALRGHLRRFTYYPKKLTNQELQTLTAI